MDTCWRLDLSSKPIDGDYLTAYLEVAPISFALNRAIECKVLSRLAFDPPVLDVGCGDGLFAEILFGKMGLDAGIDLSIQELSRAHRRGAYRVVALADSGRLPFAAGTFNTVLCNSVLEHIPDLDQTLDDVRLVLRPGGSLIVTIPTDRLASQFFYAQLLDKAGLHALARRYERAKNRLWRHHHMYSAEAWEERLALSGFDVDLRLPMATARAMTICDLFFPLAAPAPLLKKLERRTTLRPRFTARIVAHFLRTTYQTDDSSSPSICIVSHKRQ